MSRTFVRKVYQSVANACQCDMSSFEGLFATLLPPSKLQEILGKF